MQRKRHSAEQIIRKLREAEVELANGASIADVRKKLGVYGLTEAHRGGEKDNGEEPGAP